MLRLRKSAAVTGVVVLALAMTPLTFADGQTVTKATALNAGNAEMVVGMSISDKGLSLVGVEAENGNAYYTVDRVTKKTMLVLKAENEATEAVISPNGQYIAYTDNNGGLFVKSLKDQHAYSIASENDPKMELTWSEDSSRVYFLMGEKIDVIARVNINNVFTEKLVDDKVPYKSDFVISKDQKNAIYLVTKPATLNDKDAALAVDTKGTEPQYFTVDLTKKGSKAVQLTKTMDNKLSAVFNSNTSIAYISAANDSETTKVMSISLDGKESKVVFSEQTVISLSMLGETEGYLALTTDSASNKSLVQIRMDGKSKRIGVLDKGSYSIQSVVGGYAYVLCITDQGEKVIQVNLKSGTVQSIPQK